MEVVDTDPAAFLASFEDAQVRADMRRLDALCVEAMPGRARQLYEGTFWGGTEQRILGYGLIEQPRPKGDAVRWFLAGLARQKQHYSLYVNAVEGGRYVAHGYADRLGKVKLGAASIGFTSLDRVDLDVLAEVLAHAHRVTDPDVS